MQLKSFLIMMTWVAVVSDYLLHPFYPQFFELRFGISDPGHVGYYFSSICLVIMVSFPFWAQVSKKVPELNILICTQFIAGILALFCYHTTSYYSFWMISLTMILFKGSYLLVYPYILKIISKEEHSYTISLLSLVVHSGGILGAIAGGLTVDWLNAEHIFLFMATGDFILMGTSIYLLTSSRHNIVKAASSDSGKKEPINFKNYIVKIGLVTFILYFSDFLIRPFFSRYWEYISEYDSQFISGTVYAVPGLMAILALWINKKWQPSNGTRWMLIHLLLGIIGLTFQGSGITSIVLIGRIMYGWAIFQTMVRFDLLLFAMSAPESYSTDYSKLHFFQNLGVLIASFTSGILVEHYYLQTPFIVAAITAFAVLTLYYLLFVLRIKSSQTTDNKQLIYDR